MARCPTDADLRRAHLQRQGGRSEAVPLAGAGLQGGEGLGSGRAGGLQERGRDVRHQQCVAETTAEEHARALEGELVRLALDGKRALVAEEVRRLGKNELADP